MDRETSHRYSSIPIDQSTEHTICWLKNESGVIGNQEDPQTVRRHQAAIPELARMIREFESVTDSDEEDAHHEMYLRSSENLFKGRSCITFEKL